MSRPMFPGRGIGVVAGYYPLALALTAWLVLAFMGTVLCIGLGWLDTRDDRQRRGRAGGTKGAASRVPRMTHAAPRFSTVDEPSTSGWVPLLYIAAVVYLLGSVIVGIRVVSVSGRGPIAAGILWIFSARAMPATQARVADPRRIYYRARFCARSAGSQR